MNLRKLRKEEHGRTRKLWEKIFIEDTKKFLDYYYTEKTADNEIFIIEEDAAICSMLQLNPYKVRVNQSCFSVNYIIAVATDERYRRRGWMGLLLKRAMREMYERKEPFTFLMPAAESIYYPYDFRFVYRQQQSELTGKEKKQEAPEIVYAEERDCAELAAFANDYLKEKQVVAVRDENYYRILLAEQRSERGGIVMARQNGEIIGMYCYAKGERYELREPLFLCEDDFLHAIYQLTGNESEKVKCSAYGQEQEVPMIMVRILHLETLLKSLRLREKVDFYMEVADDFLAENNQVFHIMGNPSEGVTVVERSKERECSCGLIAIGELTSRLFGYPSKEDAALEKELSEQLEKIVPLSKVFLNEVV